MSSYGLLLLLLALKDASRLPDFSETWYREVIEGDISTAAETYARIYQSPFQGPPADVRRKAAFRAGSCFERLGRLENARNAYSWLVASASQGAAAGRTGSPGGASEFDALLTDPLAARAAARLRALQAGARGPGGPDSPEPKEARAPERSAPAHDAMALMAAWVAANRRLGHQLTGLEREAALRRERVADLKVILRRLEEHGVVLVFPAGSDWAARAGLRDRLLALLRESLAGEEEPRLALVSRALGRRFLRRALARCAAGDPGAALLDLHASIALSADDVAPVKDAAPASLDGGAREALEWLRASVGETAALSTSADRRLLDLHLRDWVATERELWEGVESARRLASERRRPDLAQAELGKLLDLLHWAAPTVRQEQEIRALERRAEEMFLLLDGGPAAAAGITAAERATDAGAAGANSSKAASEKIWADLWREHANAVDRLLELAVDLLDSVLRESSHETPVAAGGAGDIAGLGRKELQRHLLQARECLARADESGVQRSLAGFFAVAGWIPQADPRLELREEAGALLQALPAAKKGSGREKDEGKAEQERKE